MAGLRTQNTCFQARVSERKRIEAVVEYLDITKTEFLREITMREVAMYEKKMKG